MSVALMVQAVGALLGSILCGLVFDRVNHELAFAIASLIQGLSTILAPFIGGLVPFMVAMCLQAISIGFIMAGGYSYCVRLWSGHRYRDPILHTWAAVWSLGATVGPSIVAPFLVDLPQQHQSASNTLTGSTSSFINDNNRGKVNDADTIRYNYMDNVTIPSFWNLTFPHPSDVQLTVGVSGVEKVSYAYITIGSLALVSHLPFVAVCLHDCFKSKGGVFGNLSSSSQSSKNSKNSNSAESHAAKQLTELSASRTERLSESAPIVGDNARFDRYLYLIFLLQVFLFYHLYRYGTAIPPMYMTTFVIKYLDFRVQSASLLMSLFYGLQFVARVIGIPVAAFVTPGKMLIFNVVTTAFFFVLLLALVKVWPTIIWITIPLAGFALSTTFSAGMLWISDHITITGRISSLILVGHTSGAIVGPLIVGQLFESSTPMWFVYVLTASSVILAILLCVLMVYGDYYGYRVTRYANADRLSSHDDVSVESSKKSGYKSVNESDDRLELTSNSERLN